MTPLQVGPGLGGPQRPDPWQHLNGVGDGVDVGLIVDVGVIVAVVPIVRVGVTVGVTVLVGVRVGVPVGVNVGVRVGVIVGVGLTASIAVVVGVRVGVAVGVCVGALVLVDVAVGVLVGVRVGPVGVKVGVLVGVLVGRVGVMVTHWLRVPPLQTAFNTGVTVAPANWQTMGGPGVAAPQKNPKLQQITGVGVEGVAVGVGLCPTAAPGVAARTLDAAISPIMSGRVARRPNLSAADLCRASVIPTTPPSRSHVEIAFPLQDGR